MVKTTVRILKELEDVDREFEDSDYMDVETLALKLSEVAEDVGRLGGVALQGDTYRRVVEVYERLRDSVSIEVYPLRRIG